MNLSIEPITGHYCNIDIDGAPARIYFEQAGLGVPLVCLHTAGSHSSQWRHLMCDSTITDRFNVIAFDLPWHGKSDPPEGWQDIEYSLSSDQYVSTIMAFVRAHQLHQPVVIGCSMGGRVVIRLNRQHGDELGAVIGLEASDHPSPWYDDSWLEDEAFLRGDFCAALVSGLASPASPSERVWETLWHYYQSGPGVFLGDMHFYRTDSSFQHESAEIDTEQCPMYLMTGEYDYSCKPENTHRTVERIDGAKAIIMEGLGHFPMSEDPLAFRQYLMPVLDEILASKNFKDRV